MEINHSLALIAAYYLSKFDKVAYEQLGFKNSTKTHEEIGSILGVKASSVKNMRDEFDPLHDNARAGWYQRPLRPSRAKVVEAFQELKEEELRDVVLEILTNNDFSSSDNFNDVIMPIASRESKNSGKSVFIVRGPTGRKAEEHFINYHATTQKPVNGTLLDTRDLGCGYDFEVTNEKGSYKIEVKGLDGDSGGVLFTSKEWDVAKAEGDSYFLVLVRNVSTEPSFQIIPNPAHKLRADRSVYTTVQVRWNIKEDALLNV